jgi:antitoxin Phd
LPSSKKNPKGTKPRLQPPATWQLQNAKAQFSEVIRRACAEGPQVITKQGKEEAVVLPIERYRELTARSRQPKSLVQFFAESPLAEVELQLKRAPDFGRKLDL